jgi:vacuolar-type H+-ATPase subunit F/Vma7
MTQNHKKNHETTWGSLQVGFVQYQEIKHLKKKLKELFKKLKENKCTFVHVNNNYNKMLGCRI